MEMEGVAPPTEPKEASATMLNSQNYCVCPVWIELEGPRIYFLAVSDGNINS